MPPVCMDEMWKCFSLRAQGDQIALENARNEIAASTSLKNAQLISASCDFDAHTVRPGTHVTSSISVSVPAAVVPGIPVETSWTMNSRHIALVPKYRSMGEP